MLAPTSAGFLHGWSWTDFKFLVAETIGLFAIAGKEIGEARARIAGDMLDQRRNGI